MLVLKTLVFLPSIRWRRQLMIHEILKETQNSITSCYQIGNMVLNRKTRFYNRYNAFWKDIDLSSVLWNELKNVYLDYGCYLMALSMVIGNAICYYIG